MLPEVSVCGSGGGPVRALLLSRGWVSRCNYQFTVFCMKCLVHCVPVMGGLVGVGLQEL